MVMWEQVTKGTLTRHRDTYPFIDPSRFRGTLSGKVVAITGVHRGLGRASAIAFAAAGASVVCIARTMVSLQSVIGEIAQHHKTPTLAIAANLLDARAPARIVELTEKWLGPIDVLVNITSGSYLRPFAEEKDITLDWWSTLELNLKSPIALIHAVLPSMLARGQGTIISTTFLSGISSVPFVSSDATSRAALLKFHHLLDKEVRPKGVVSFAVHPGLVASHLYDPDSDVQLNPEDFENEPRMKELTELTGQLEWCGAGLASGTFVALVADPRAKCLSGLYINAERDLGEMIKEVEKGPGNRVEKERLYELKLDEL